MEDLMYGLYRRTAKIASRLPWRLRGAMAAVGGTVAWALAPRARAHVAANVAQVVGPSARGSMAGRLRVQRIGRRIFCACIHNYLDLFASPPPQEAAARMDMTGTAYLEEALAQGRGVIVFSAHLGPFEYTSSWFTHRGYNLVIPVENLQDKRMLELMLDLRRRNGVDFVPLDGVGALRTMYGALRKNQIVLITADRAVAGESVVIDFFGAPARLPRGPVDLSLRTGAPLVGAFGWRGPGERVTGEFTRLTFAVPEDERDKPEVLQAAMARELERIVRDHIDQWVVFEPVWAGS